jgi:serine/threonine protein phosphatase PrpC
MKYKIAKPQAINAIGGRENQEDTIFPREGTGSIKDRLFIICDGNGGHDRGELASILFAKR